MTLSQARSVPVCEAFDATYSRAFAPIVIAAPQPAPPVDDVDCIMTTLDSVLERVGALGGPVGISGEEPALLPHREGDATRLRPVDRGLVMRIERDLVVVHRGRGSDLTPGRVFGVDFRRGMTVEWAELAQHLDVERALFGPLRRKLTKDLRESTTSTVNLPHEPSAGGTTLSRQLAWSLMEEYPTVIIHQLTNDTRGYLRELFQECNLPLLVVMEAEIVTESAREDLWRTLREDNTRAAFLWVSRLYGDTRSEDVLRGSLSDVEAGTFLDAYLEQVEDPLRRDALRKLANDRQLAEQRSPFFFGLTAFGEHFVGLDRLVTDTLTLLTPTARSLIADLALVSGYSSDGFPEEEFAELCQLINGGALPFNRASPFAISVSNHLKIPHRLIAERTLGSLARDQKNWRADLRLFAAALLDHLRRLRHVESDRLRRMVETLFLTRDTTAALENDADVQTGNLSRQRRFSPLIQDIGNAESSRSLLRVIVTQWPTHPHYSVHYARHLLYEQPREIDQAIAVAAGAERNGTRDDAVIHNLGMCYRIRMEAALIDARERGLRFEAIEDSVKSDFAAATGKFITVTDLAPTSEYGRVASIQTVSTLVRSAVQLSGAGSFADFVALSRNRWCMEAMSLAEAEIAALRDRPERTLSVRAQRTIAEWSLVYGNVDRVVQQLRTLVQRHEDNETRRALCNAIVAKHRRQWAYNPTGGSAYDS